MSKNKNIWILPNGKNFFEVIKHIAEVETGAIKKTAEKVLQKIK